MSRFKLQSVFPVNSNSVHNASAETVQMGYAFTYYFINDGVVRYCLSFQRMVAGAVRYSMTASVIRDSSLPAA
ncbi:hypothetical protein [Chitinophaga sp. CF418]|uniref:hypothetical protein n=1 Tax=Chitinophaga sp. CF418 TaxID=1855287 RepID=UPI00122CCD7B|nr:hypothetical protein [Chitinophaga sp. CF418]